MLGQTIEWRTSHMRFLIAGTEKELKKKIHKPCLEKMKNFFNIFNLDEWLDECKRRQFAGSPESSSALW